MYFPIALTANGCFAYLEDVRSVNEAHEREKASVGPAVDGNAIQVHKLVLVRYIVQTLHLVFNLHLTLMKKDDEGIEWINGYHYAIHLV